MAFPEEIALLIDCMSGDHVRLPVFVIFLQGRRPSEIIHREWSDLEWKRGKARLFLGMTKAGEEQWIALDDAVADELKKLAGRRLREGRERVGQDFVLEGPIFLNSRGQPWHNGHGHHGSTLGKPFREGRAKAVAKMLEMARDATDPDIRDELKERAAIVARATMYWGRHNVVSHHVAAGTAPQVIAIWWGGSRSPCLGAIRTSPTGTSGTRCRG